MFLICIFIDKIKPCWKIKPRNQKAYFMENKNTKVKVI